MDDERPREYRSLTWEMILGGAHVSHGSRFKILRRRANEWILTDTVTGKQMRLSTLGDAKLRAEWIVNNEG